MVTMVYGRSDMYWYFEGTEWWCKILLWVRGTAWFIV